MGDKSKVISDCKEIIKLLDDSSELEKEIEHHTARVNEIVVLVQNLIDKNASFPMSQEEFQSKYVEYDNEYKELNAKVNEIEESIRHKKAQSKNIQAFISDLSNRPSAISEWDEEVWNYLVEKATVNEGGSITFLFKSGEEVNVK